MGKQFLAIIGLIFLSIAGVDAQQNGDKKNKQQQGRPVTIPVTVRVKDLKIKNGGNGGETRGELINLGNLTIKENGEERKVLSVRSTSNAPLALAVLIQDDLDSQVNLELKGLKEFVRSLPRGSRVMVAYLRGGSLDVRQKFTDDLEKAATGLRILVSSQSAAPYNPFVGVSETLDRFNNLPAGRRAILLVSDGLDTSRGVESASPSQSIDLDRAILKAQRASVAVYSIYANSTSSGNSNNILVSYGQGSLNRLTDETGGRAFFQGTSTPVSFDPYLREIGTLLNRQFALTFLSTTSKKDLLKLEITSDNQEIRIDYPKNVIRR